MENSGKQGETCSEQERNDSTCSSKSSQAPLDEAKQDQASAAQQKMETNEPEETKASKPLAQEDVEHKTEQSGGGCCGGH